MNDQVDADQPAALITTQWSDEDDEEDGECVEADI